MRSGRRRRLDDRYIAGILAASEASRDPAATAWVDTRGDIHDIPFPIWTDADHCHHGSTCDTTDVAERSARSLAHASGSMVISEGAPEAGAAGVIFRGRSGVRQRWHIAGVDDGSVCLLTQAVPLLVSEVGTRTAHHSPSWLCPTNSAREPFTATPNTGNSRVGPLLNVAGSRIIT